MTKTVWINGTERCIEKDRYKMYHVFLDDEDVKWLNNVHIFIGIYQEAFKRDIKELEEASK